MEVNKKQVMFCCQEEGSSREKGTSEYVAVNLLYVGSEPTVIRGPVTGKIYRFTHLERTQSVDPRDAVDLLADRQFRLAR